MKMLSVLLFLLLSSTQFLVSQVTVSIGTQTGASSTNVLLSTSTTTNKYSRTMSIYSVSEILSAGGFAGTISSLGWLKGGTGEYQFNDAYIKVFLKHINDTVWPTSPVPAWDTEVLGATEVFTSSTYSLPTGAGWITIPFTTPFVWNGTSHVVVMVEWYRPSTPTGDITWARTTLTSTNATRVGSASLSALIMLVNSSRPLVQLTITPGATVPVSAVSVATQNNVPPVITSPGGTLQMTASVIPAASNQAVTWSLVTGTGNASISATGLVSALANGTVWAKAVSVQDTAFMDSLQITISNQIVPVTGVVVSTSGAIPPVITTNAGTLQLQAEVMPAAADQSVTWSVVPGTGSGTITATGLLTALSNGTVWAKAVSVQDNAFKDSLLVEISNQTVQITGVVVSTQGGVPAIIDVKAGTLQLEALVLPLAAIQDVTWSVVPGTGTASVSLSGLVTAMTNGTVWAKAISVQNPAFADSVLITITNQETGINENINENIVSIFPNPLLNGLLNIEIANLPYDEHVVCALFDMHGKQVHRSIISNAAQQVSLHHIPAGTYTLLIWINQQQYARKIVIGNTR